MGLVERLTGPEAVHTRSSPTADVAFNRETSFSIDIMMRLSPAPVELNRVVSSVHEFFFQIAPLPLVVEQNGTGESSHGNGRRVRQRKKEGHSLLTTRTGRVMARRFRLLNRESRRPRSDGSEQGTYLNQHNRRTHRFFSPVFGLGAPELCAEKTQR